MIGDLFDFLSYESMLCSHKNCLIKMILISTHNIPFQYKTRYVSKVGLLRLHG